MIHEVIPIIADELNDYLDSKFDTSEDPVILSNILNQDGTIAVREENKIIVSLVNIERDGSNLMGSGGLAAGDLPIHVNLYVMFSAYFTNYFESLKFLSGVIGFFQANPSFIIDGSNILAEFHNVDFREMSNIWAGMGAKYLPCVLFRFRTLNMDDDRINDEIPPVSGSIIDN
jgi:hypothetical protein